MTTINPHHTVDAPVEDDLRRLRWTNQHLSQWLVQRRNDGTTPDQLTTDLVRAGWDADTAARIALRSLRSADRQSLMYAALCWSAGLGALGAGSSAHLALAGNPSPMELTAMLTLTLVAVPIAVVCAIASRRVERGSRYVLWSPTRRGWFGTLALCTGTIGVLRLLVYLFQALSTLTGASDEPFTAAGAAQVLVTLSIAVPLFVWSFHEWRRSNLVIASLSKDAEASDGDRLSTPTP